MPHDFVVRTRPTCSSLSWRFALDLSMHALKKLEGRLLGQCKCKGPPVSTLCDPPGPGRSYAYSVPRQPPSRHGNEKRKGKGNRSATLALEEMEVFMSTSSFQQAVSLED